jgi:hypothetical protein
VAVEICVELPVDTGDRVERLHDIAVVIPVYRGAHSLDVLLGQLAEFFEESLSPAGHRFLVDEVILVWDHGPDESPAVMRELAMRFPQVRPLWLSRNFGQHAATLAGISSSGASWVITMDEDGQHDPTDIGLLLDCAVSNSVPLVYGHHRGGAPHARWRNLASKSAHRIGRWVAGNDSHRFSSYRLILGSYARSVAAYCGPRMYLDVALTWAVQRSETVEVSTPAEVRPGSGYGMRQLVGHFLTLVLSSGTRPLRMVASSGVAVALIGFAVALLFGLRRVLGDIEVPGWASVVVTVLVLGGIILVVLGVLAEYLGLAVSAAQGKPTYLLVDDQADGPLG